MSALHSILLTTVGCLQLLSATSVFGQASEWERYIADGDAAAAKSQYLHAEESYRQALQYAESHWKKDARISGALIKLAESCNAQGKKDDAEALANRAVAALSDALKARKPKDASEELQQTEVSTAITDKAGDIFAANQKYQDAEDLYLKVIAIRERYANEKPPSNPNNEDFLRFIAQSLGNAQAKVADSDDKLGRLYRIEGKYQEAARQYQKSEEIREKQFGSDKPPVAQSLSDIAMCYALQGKYDQAEPLYKRVITILEHNNDQEKPEMAAALENYSLVLRKTGRDAEGKPVSERALEIRTKLASTAH
jgi:tetratricopeptide (TPR) repeat protein